MTRTVSAVGTARLAPAGKRLIGQLMYEEGKHFVLAGLLLQRQNGSHAVVLHLFCQGIEITLKGLLLAADYDRFQPMLKSLGHDLVRLVDEARKVAGLSAPRPRLADELQQLNKLYSRHRLRYASGHRIFVDPATIPCERVMRRFVALLRLVERRQLMT